MINRFLLFSFFSLIILAACGNKNTHEAKVQLPYYKEATFTPHWLSPNDIQLNDFHKISEFNFTNQDGNKVSQETFKDKIYVTDFFFTTCPGICPKMTANLGVIQEAFRNEDDVLLLSHSVTPNRDSVEVLKAYAIENNVLSDKWHLVTGPQQEIYDMGRKAYFVEEDLGLEQEPDEFLHTENFVLIDRNGFIRGIYNGLNKTSIKHLIEDIKLIL